MYHPVISIIVPVYNVEQYLHECIDSVIEQTYSFWELILVDDGSLDSSGNICDEYSNNFVYNNKSIRVFHKENGGVSSARNLGLDMMKGEWVTFLDADDALAPNALEICLKIAEDNNLDMLQFNWSHNSNEMNACSGHSVVYNSQMYIEADKVQKCIAGQFIRSALIKDNNIKFDTKLKLAEDLLFVMTCLLNANRIEWLSDTLYFYRRNEKSAVFNKETEDCVDSIIAIAAFKKEYPIIGHLLTDALFDLMHIIIQQDRCPAYKWATLIHDANMKGVHRKITKKSLIMIYKVSDAFPLLGALMIIFWRFKLKYTK